MEKNIGLNRLLKIKNRFDSQRIGAWLSSTERYCRTLL